MTLASVDSSVLVSRHRWTGVGSSGDPDPFVAGADAARAAVVGASPKLLVVFCSVHHAQSALLAGIHSVAAGVPLIGCSTAGEIATERTGDDSVVVMAIGGPGMTVATGVGVALDGDLRRAGEEAASCVSSLDSRAHRVLLLLSDGLAGDQQEVVRGAYRVAGATVPLVGGCAGDGLRMQQTQQLCGDRVLQGAVVAAAIASDAPIGIGVRHGWRRVGEPMLITSSQGHVVRTLNDEPALDVYLRLLGAPPEAHVDSAAFTQFAITHPLGLSRRRGEEVRFVGEADFEDRSLVCIAEVPQAGLTWFMEGDERSVLAATDAACDDAFASLGGEAPIGLLAFDCIARRGVLGESGIQTEVARIAARAAGAPVAGFYTYGEIARTHGVSGFHNQTLVVLALA